MSEVTEQKPKTCTVLIRARTPDGFEAEVTFDEVPRVGASEFITAVSTAMKGHGFVGAWLGGPSVAAESTASKKPSGGKYTGEVYKECPDCGGVVYDNRQKKNRDASWRGPWFKCKDTDCGWAVFKNDGSAE